MVRMRGSRPPSTHGNLFGRRSVAWSMSAGPAPTPTPRLDGLEAALQDVLAAVPPDPPVAPRPGRPPIVAASLLWTGLLVCVLRAFTAQSSLWQLLVLRGPWTFPRVNVTPQAIYDRRKHAPLEPLWELFAQVTAVLRTRYAALQDLPEAPAGGRPLTV